MKVFISDFYHVRFFRPNMIPMSTAGGRGGPLWYIGGDTFHPKCFLDKNNVMNGIREEKLAFPNHNYEKLETACGKDCGYHHQLELHNEKEYWCPFMKKYRDYLETVDINYLLSEFNRVAEDVRSITHFADEPEIVLLVYETARSGCGERQPLIDYFKSHGVDIKEWSQDELQNGAEIF